MYSLRYVWFKLEEALTMLDWKAAKFHTFNLALLGKKSYQNLV